MDVQFTLKFSLGYADSLGCNTVWVVILKMVLFCRCGKGLVFLG